MQAGVEKKRANLQTKLKARGGIKKNRKEKDDFNWRDDYSVPEWVVSQVHPKRRWLLRWLDQRPGDMELRAYFSRSPAGRVEAQVAAEAAIEQMDVEPGPITNTQASGAAAQESLAVDTRDPPLAGSAAPAGQAVTAAFGSEVGRAAAEGTTASLGLLAEGTQAGRSPAGEPAHEPLDHAPGLDTEQTGRHNSLLPPPSPVRVKKRKILRKGSRADSGKAGEEQEKRDDDAAVEPVSDKAAEQAVAQAELELREQSERRAQKQTEASLAQEKVQEAAHQAEVEAEQELAEAAERQGAAQAASSLRRETLRAAPDPLADAPPEPQASQQSSEHADNTTGDPPPPPAELREAMPTLSASGKHSPSPLEERSAQLEPDPSQSRAPSQDIRHAKSKGTHGGDTKRRKVAAGSAEPENGKPKLKKKRSGGMTSNAPTAETRGSGDMGHIKNNGQKGSPAKWSKGVPEDSHLSPVRPNGKQAPLTLVDFQEEGQQERLGELDLKQLASFRDLWTTIKSAYSARLPRDELKLVYQDKAGDLLLLQPDEPWLPFVESTRRIVVSCKWPR